MSTSKQVLYISILFLGLMLLSAGVGALLAGEMGFGLLFLAGGVFLTGIDATILYLLWKRTRNRQRSENELTSQAVSGNEEGDA